MNGRSTSALSVANDSESGRSLESEATVDPDGRDVVQLPSPALVIDWCSHQAAKYAVEKWHYSGSLPPPPMVRVGVWEHGKFIGCVLFARGASPALLKPYGLDQTQGCELVRVALSKHEAPVTKIVAAAIAKLKAAMPDLQLIVSFADPAQGHAGTIYQAGNWIYNGETPASVEYIGPKGKRWHGRMVSKTGIATVYGKKRRVLRTDQCTKVKCPGKHRYLMPLNKRMRRQLQKISQPYPVKRTDVSDSNTEPEQS